MVKVTLLKNWKRFDFLQTRKKVQSVIRLYGPEDCVSCEAGVPCGEVTHLAL